MARACGDMIACGCRRRNAKMPATYASASPKPAAVRRSMSWTAIICARATSARGGMPTSPRARLADTALRISIPPRAARRSIGRNIGPCRCATIHGHYSQPGGRNRLPTGRLRRQRRGSSRWGRPHRQPGSFAPRAPRGRLRSATNNAAPGRNRLAACRSPRSSHRQRRGRETRRVDDRLALASTKAARVTTKIERKTFLISSLRFAQCGLVAAWARSDRAGVRR